MRFVENGVRVFHAHTARSLKRRGQWLSRRACKYVLRRGAWEWLIDWWPWHGLQVVAVRQVGAPDARWEYSWERQGDRTMRRLKVGAEVGGEVPAASAESALLKRLPKVLEHCTATKYEDGGARTPGYLWIKVSGTAWTVTVFDPDGGARLDCRASALDEALMLAERWLGAEDAPWEVDQYLRDRQAQKRPKKRA